MSNTVSNQFKWLPAGSGNNTYAGVSIYVKFKPRIGEFREVQSHNGFKLYLKDRELFITRAGFKEYNHYTPITGYDYCIDADLNGYNSAVKHNALMLTYTSKLSKRRLLVPKRRPDESNYVVSDSGGFQILMGKESFIDPRDLAAFANRYCNRTMTLDIAPPRGLSYDNLIKAAYIQTLNTKLLKENLDDDISVYNIAHGYTVQERRDYIDIVNTDDTDYWAFGTLYYGNTHDVIQNLLGAITYVEAKSYHVFGVGNTLLLPILAWIGKYVNLTADSSSHLQSGRASTVFSMNGNKFRKVNMGRARDEVFRSANEYSHLPCSCGICNALGTSEVFTNSNISNASHSLAILHNINVMTRYSNIWNDLAQTLSVDKYIAKLNNIIKPKDKYFWREAILFIENIFEHGVDRASELNRGNLSLFTKPPQSLFGNTEDEYDPNEQVEGTIELYSEFYRDMDIKIPRPKKADKLKNKAGDAMGISTSSNSAKTGRRRK